MLSFAIQIPSPSCSIKKYADMTGQSESRISKDVQAGKLPILPKESSKSAVQINLVAIYQRNAELALHG